MFTGQLHGVDGDNQPFSAGLGMERYLDVLEDSQVAYLHALSEAQRSLSNTPLEALGATHARHARQFLDAQRAIIRLRADDVVRVARFESEGDAEIADILDSAGVGEIAPERHNDGRPGAERQGGVDEELRSRQLRSLLDEWWRQERMDRVALVDEARARASMRVYMARLRASAELDCGDPVPGPDAMSMLPPEMVEALVGSDDAAIESLIGTLLGLLEPEGGGAIDTAQVVEGSQVVAVPETQVPGGGGLPAHVPSGPASEPPDDALGRTAGACGDIHDQPVDQTELRIRTVDEFDRFWGTGPSSTARRFNRWWLVTQVALPMSAVVIALVMVLAFVG
jgi:hypothetical protein